MVPPALCCEQHGSGLSTAENTGIASVELSLDATSKSAAHLTVTRQRPVSVPVHTLTADPAFHNAQSRMNV